MASRVITPASPSQQTHMPQPDLPHKSTHSSIPTPQSPYTQHPHPPQPQRQPSNYEQYAQFAQQPRRGSASSRASSVRAPSLKYTGRHPQNFVPQTSTRQPSYAQPQGQPQMQPQFQSHEQFTRPTRASVVQSPTTDPYAFYLDPTAQAPSVPVATEFPPRPGLSGVHIAHCTTPRRCPNKDRNKDKYKCRNNLSVNHSHHGTIRGPSRTTGYRCVLRAKPGMQAKFAQLQASLYAPGRSGAAAAVAPQG